MVTKKTKQTSEPLAFQVLRTNILSNVGQCLSEQKVWILLITTSHYSCPG